MGFNGLSLLFAASVFFELTWGNSESFSELMEQAQQEFAGTAKCISRNYGIYQ
jgi:hypothetical protein